jgi:hypothetical protein
MWRLFWVLWEKNWKFDATGTPSFIKFEIFVTAKIILDTLKFLNPAEKH